MFRDMTNDITYRLLARVVEVATEPETPDAVKEVYECVVAERANAFCQAHEAVSEAEGALDEARRTLRELFVDFDPAYLEARSIVLAFFPSWRLPDTLKAQPTNTELLAAVKKLSKAVQSNAGATWAQALLKGPFGTLAPKAIEALQASITASKALAAARQARKKAHRPAYDKYMVFKRVVRDSMGRTSAQYRRLHLRSSVAKKIEQAVEEEAPASGIVPSTKAGATDSPIPPTSVKTG